jgi:hypothetical protein
MNTKELNAWNNFKKHVNGRINMKRIESIGSGMSDTININANGVTFWMEVKALYKWPAREKTCPLRNAFEPGQVPFLREWRCWKGQSFVLLKVADSYYLLDPDDPLDEMNTSELINHAVSFDIDGIILFLMNLGKNRNEDKTDESSSYWPGENARQA